MPTFHILSQYVWPDSAPTALYADQLAIRMHEQGHDVRLVGGSGSYRSLGRDKPPVTIRHLAHYRGRRGNLAQVFAEYVSVKRAFADYIDNVVQRSDVVIATTAPPNTVRLAHTIKRRGAHAVYWLQDYYPELVRGIHEYPAPMRRAFSAYWNAQLSQWDRVVKIGSNLGGPTRNAVVIRNWPTLSFDQVTAPEPKTALYSGNFGYGHDVDLFVRACEDLRDRGYRLTIRCDGRGAGKLPSWLKVQPLHTNPEELKADLLRHEVHLIAANPKITRAIFPSKIWNSIALSRRLICTGFAGEMARELELAQAVDFTQHLEHWTELLAGFGREKQRTVIAPPVQILTPAAIA
jgi:glycosyltransferase involved in cell wall biosynthesis